MARNRQNRGLDIFSRLKTRVAISYVVITLILVLLLEGLVLTVVFWFFTRSPFLSFITQDSASTAARIYALQAAVEAEDGENFTSITFEPGHANTLDYQKYSNGFQLSDFHLNIPYIEPGTTPPNNSAVALVVGPGGEIIASSYPDLYPVSAHVEQLLPEESELIRNSLAGDSDNILRRTTQGNFASVAQTIWSADQEVLGTVYIRTPAGGIPNSNVFAQVIGVLIPSSIAWLCLMLPIGLLFGFLTMRGVIRRIERLGYAAERFTEGDFSQRVRVVRADEIGQLVRASNSARRLQSRAPAGKNGLESNRS